MNSEKQKFRRRTNSIRVKIVLLLLTVGASSLVAFQVFWRPQVSQFVENLTVEQSEDTIHTLVDSLIPYLIQNQYAAMVENLDQHKVRHPELHYIELTGTDGRKFYPVVGARPGDLESLSEINHTINFRGDDIASLSAFLDLSETRNALNDQLLALGIIGVIAFIGLGVFMAVFLEISVSRRIQKLADVTEDLSRGNFNGSLPLPGDDEIGTLVKSFERMRENIRITQVSLEEALNQAESASNAKSEFLATMSHEIRTPLNGVIGMAHLLAETNLSDKQRFQVNTIRNSGKMLLGIINDILDFSKLEADGMELEQTRFSVRDLLESIGSMMDLHIRGMKNQLRIVIEPSIETNFVGDESRIRQIILNLVNNANKFTKEGLIEISARLVRTSEKTTRVRFAVKDNGIGIPKDKTKTLFDRFTQVDSSHARKFDGAGLGLAICKQLVDLMEGDIGVESLPGLGSTFWIEIDLDRVASTRNEQVAHGKATDCTQQTDHAGISLQTTLKPTYGGSLENPTTACSGLRILVVEDNVVNQQLVVMLLESCGHRVHVAANGKEAVEFVESVCYDLIFMDMQMPEMDGIEATRRIRKLDRTVSNIPIVAMTANVQPRDEALCREAGMDGFITKPIDKRLLEEMISKWGEMQHVAF